MSYSSAWSNIRPPGSTAAKLIDDEIRLLRQQIEERMTGTLVIDWKADPVVPIVAGTGALNSKTILIPNVAFVGTTFTGLTFQYFNNYTLVSENTGAYAPIYPINFGTKITKVEYLLDINTVPSVDCILYSVDLFSGNIATTGIINFLHTIRNSSAGVQHVTSAPLSIDLNPDYAYHVGMFSSETGDVNSFKVYGARVTLT